MTGFEQLERQLIASVARRRRRRARAGILAVSGGIAVALAVAVGALLLVGHRTPTTSVPAGPAAPMVPKDPALPYLLRAAQATRGQCGQATSIYLIRDVSILGVLRRPATPADTLPSGQATGLGQGAYLPFVRRARTIGGVTYYIWPEIKSIPGGAALVRRCAAAEHRALKNQHVPARLRPAAERAAAQLFGGSVLWPGICLAEVHVSAPGFHNYFNSSGCGSTAAEIERGGGGGGSGAGTITGVVPDGVAWVALRYNGRTFTQRVVGNVFAIRLAAEGAPFPQLETWHATDGRVIKTIRG